MTEEEQRYKRHWGMRDPYIRSIMEELDERNEVKCGDAYLVRIPKIEGKITTRQIGLQTYVEYIYESSYDPISRQNRNKKARIGQAIETYPGAMLPNDNYYKYFDRVTGEVRKNQEEVEEVTKRQELIRDVMENEGMIGRDVERIREMIRGNEEENERETGAQGGSPVLDENCPLDSSDQAGEPLPKSEIWAGPHPDALNPQFVRRRILLDMLTSMREVIKDQARKRPEEVVPAYQVEKINPVLEEIRKIETELGYGEMLELIQKPRTRIDAKSGETVIEGMTYGDAEILMECYNSVIWFTRGEIL